MKPLKYLLALVFLNGPCSAQDQSAAQSTGVKELIESRRFEFVAQTANPLRGRVINLTSEYTFTVLPDTIMSHLPYFGRAYQARLDPDDAGITFTSTDFSYNVKERKKGRWDIAIKPKDVMNAPNANLSVSPNGYASLHIISTDRQAISFRGVIRKTMTGE
jgi:hypothetical protein